MVYWKMLLNLQTVALPPPRRAQAVISSGVRVSVSGCLNDILEKKLHNPHSYSKVMVQHEDHTASQVPETDWSCTVLREIRQ